tara:strand:- start:2172 stop:6083 length:3912 start_codon:yes stop_codon:yes gene_type:complete
MNTINTILKQGLVALLAIFVSVGTVHAQEMMSHSNGVFFSEYIEGGGQNKAFEIFNSTSEDIDLGNYIVLGNYNGNPFNDTLRFPVGTMLASMDVFVVAHEDADSKITEVADSLIENPFSDGTSYITAFNGDDARALVHIDGTDSTIVDYFGTSENDPGSGWDVAGISAGTKDHTLVRKVDIKRGNPIPLSSFGTKNTNSEWEVFDKDNLDFIGDHKFEEYKPMDPDGIIVNKNSDFQDVQLGTAANVDGWFFQKTDYATFDFIADTVNPANTLQKTTITDIENAPNAFAVQVASSGNVIKAGTEYMFKARLYIEASNGDATAKINFTTNTVGVNKYGMVVNTGEWLDLSISDTPIVLEEEVTANIGVHLSHNTQVNGDIIYLDYIRVIEVKKEPVMVHFNVNTSTMPDTLRGHHFMQIRGGFVGPDVTGAASDGMITWDSMSRHMYSMGGDYWWSDFLMSPGDTLNYKFWAGVNPDTPLTNGSEQGWESGDNNVFILPSDFAGADTTVDLQFYETREAPYPISDDSISLFFRVNMGPAIKSGNFDPATDTVGVRGSFDGWASGITLEPGANQGDNYFFEGTKQISHGEAEPITEVSYKFITMDEEGTIGWESDPNRTFDMPANDTTLHWDYFDRLGFPPANVNTEPVAVTFTVNMATLLDTLQDYHTVQLKGAPSGADAAETGLGEIITWDANTLQLDHIDGDVWGTTFDMSPGDLLNYKFWAGVDPETPLINGPEQGWESGGNNQFVLPATASGDTVVPMQWYEFREPPYDPSDDTLTILFKVNMGGPIQTGDFDPETDMVGVRGNPAFFDNPADWSTSAFYLDEVGGSGNNIFYAGIAQMPRDSAILIEEEMAYKFVFEVDGETTWESRADRFTHIPEVDTTLKWVYFNDTPPSDTPILSTTLNFEVNVGILEGLGYFNSSIDSVFVRGSFNSWGVQNEMTFNSFSGTYEESNIPLNVPVGAEHKYKYYLKWDASRDDETSTNFLAGITHDGSGWEEPGVTGGADRQLVIEDAANQPKRSEFFNGVEPKALLTSQNVEDGAISVTFSIDMSPAVENVSAPFDVSNDSVYLYADTPFFVLTQGLIVPGDAGENFMTMPDEMRESLRFKDDNGDMVYTLDLDLQLPTLNHMGFRIGYGEPTSQDGSMFTHGSGFDAGRRHYQYIQPIVAGNGSVTWPSSFTLPTLTWVAEDLAWETPPDYNTPTTSSELDESMVKKFALEQNYPNPFNPTTNISFSLADASPVKLTIYNLLGQEVARLISGKVMNAGTHTVAFNAASLSSGVYLYRLEAGSFVSNKRMTLIK